MSTADTAMLIAIVNKDGSAAVVAGDLLTEFDTSTVEDGRHAIMMHAIAAAQERVAAVRLHVTEPDGAWPLIVHADGDVEPDEDGATSQDAGSAEPDGLAPNAGTEGDDAPEEEPAPDASPQHLTAQGQHGQNDEGTDAPDAELSQRELEPKPATEAAPAAPSTQSGPIEPADPLRGSRLATTGLPVLGATFDEDDDDSDVVDDPSPESPTRRPQREATDARPASEPLPAVAPRPPAATATPKATTTVEQTPVPPGRPRPAGAPARQPAPSAAPRRDAVTPPTPVRTPAPASAPAAAAPDAGEIDLFAPLRVSPQTPGPRAPQGGGEARRPRTERSRAEKRANDRQPGTRDSGKKPTSPKEPTAPEGRRSFLTPERAEEPAEKGWRGFLAKTGLRVPPSADERAERADIFTVSQHWPGPRTIAIVNAKGGSGKTPTTILTAAVFARYGGAGVLAWDNNQTRGTLGWRTEQGPHDASLHDMLPETDRLLSAQAQSADLAHYVHHQTRDRYDVLRSRPLLLADEQRIERGDIDRIHSVAAKYYRLIVMDSGNDESDPMWRRMIDLADQIVLATTTRAEHAEAGALLLEALSDRDARSASLVENSVAIVSQADPHASAAEVRSVVDGYRDLSRDVAAIPYDPAMAGGYLHFTALRPATRRAWLGATAAIARGLGPQRP